MKHRRLGRTGFMVSEIGMGLEYLLDKDQLTINGTIRAAMDGGITYLDCHPSHGFTKESIDYEGYMKLGKALTGIRDRFILSYIAHWETRSPAETKPRFESWLRMIDTGYADVFMLQFCDKANDFEEIMKVDGALSYAQKLVKEGRARSIGISTHSAEIAQRAIESGSFDVLMYPVNPAHDVVTADHLDTIWDAAYEFNGANERGERPRKSVYIECERNNIGLVAMKPFAGGFIFGVEKNAGFTPVNLVAYALAQTGVSTVVPGCAKPDEIEGILAYNDSSLEEKDYAGVVSKSRWSVKGNCQYCNHCLPCGADINVGLVNRLLDAKRDMETVREKYRALSVKASACLRCGICEERCPFEVKVRERMEEAVMIFE